MINYLFSRIDKAKGFTKEQRKYIEQDIKNNSTITFISAMSNEPEHLKTSIENKIESFKKININFKNIYTIDENTTKEESINYLKDSNIIFLLGGAPYIQMGIINKNNLQNYIKAVPIIIGVSAGSMNQTKRVIYVDEYENKTHDYKGLNYFETSIYPHYTKELKDEINEVSKIEPILAIPDTSFIRIENSKIEYIGINYLFDNRL